ncbi:ABC transporter ATP-binding protein, partial [Halorubrum sp. SD683]
GEAILAEFERVKAEGVAVIAVTHDPLVEEYADRVVDLTDGVLTGGLPGESDPHADADRRGGRDAGRTAPGPQMGGDRG